jgi:AcrR family transcriptional regulator
MPHLANDRRFSVPSSRHPRPLRTDAQLNYDRILVAADSAFAQHGADASLEEIARQAGVGSATLHRRFPTRRALLEAVFHDRVEALCAKARELADGPDPGLALITWLRALNTYASASRGLAATLLQDRRVGSRLEQDDNCQAKITAAGGELLERARAAGMVRPGLRIGDLISLVNGISLATGHGPDADEADRLLNVAIDGIRPHGDGESGR